MSSSLSFIVPWFAELAALCWFYRLPILFVNVAVSVVVYVVMRWLYREWLREEDWVEYFASAFGVFAVVYSLRLTNSLWHPIGIDGNHPHIQTVETLASFLGSPAINVCFALAATALGAHKDRARTWRFRIALLVAALIPAAIEALGWLGPYSRWPDAMISAFILLWVGTSLFVNISVRRRPVFATLALIAASLYGLLNVLYALNPSLANEPGSHALIAKMQETLRSLSVLRGTDPLRATPLDALDAFVFATASIFKLGLFGGAVVLALRTLVVVRPKELRQTLKEIIEGRVELLTDRGVLPAIGVSFEADLVALCYTLPGHYTQPGGRKWVAWWRWLKHPEPPARAGGREVCELPSPNLAIVARVIAEGVLRSTGHRPKEYPTGYMGYVDGLNSFVTAPIRYHGAIIGALNIEWRQRKAFTLAAIPRIQLLADCLAPAVHAKRQLVALDQLTDRLSKLDLADPKNRGELLQAISRHLHEVLTPLGTGTFIDPGFRHSQVAAICVDASATPEVVEGNEEAMTAALRKRLADHPTAIEIHSSEIRIEDVTVGHLAFATSKQADDLHHPTLADDALHRRNVAALVGDALLDGRRARYARVINSLDTALFENPAPTTQAWLEIVSTAAADVGLLWTVAQLPGETEKWLGNAEDINLARAASTAPAFRSDDTAVGSAVTTTSQEPESANFILRLKLPTRDEFLWLGVARPNLRAELEPQWPWRAFLDNLAVSAGSALNRLRVQRLQFQEQQDYALMTTSVATGAFVHELQKVAARVALMIENAQVAFATGATTTEELSTKLAVVNESIRALVNHTELLVNVEKFDEKRPCYLYDAVERAADLFAPVVSQRRLKLTRELDRDLRIDVPFSVAYLAIGNLISNSIDAFWTNSWGSIIRVTSEETDGGVFCRVSDDGPGIPLLIRERIFDVNISTRTGGHGLGLYLTKRSLLNHGSSIRLKETGSSGTVFEIKFPRY